MDLISDFLNIYIVKPHLARKFKMRNAHWAKVAIRAIPQRQIHAEFLRLGGGKILGGCLGLRRVYGEAIRNGNGLDVDLSVYRRGTQGAK